MSVAMVDRLFWRAGFGPSQAQRDAWIGGGQVELVDWFLNTTLTLASTDTPPRSGPASRRSTRASSDDELVIEWVDRMQRAINPLPDRLAFFWHRHWAISRDDGTVSFEWAVTYRDRLLEFADFEPPRRSLPRDRLRDDDGGRRDVRVPEPQREHEEQARTRTTRARSWSCSASVRRTRTGAPNYVAGGHRGADAGVHRLAAERTEILPDGVTPNPDYGKITFAPSQFTMRPRPSSARTIPAVTGPTSPTTNRRTWRGARRASTRRSTSCSRTRSTRSS